MYIKALLAWFQAVRVWTPVFESQKFRMEPARDGGAGVWKQPIKMPAACYGHRHFFYSGEQVINPV
jgi:hypothetical protein